MSTPMNAPVNALANAPASPPADPLAALHGIHLPEAIGVWPPAPGWWMLLAIVVGLIVLGVVAVRFRRASLAHHALRELERIDGTSGDLQGLAIAVSELLRRVALRRFGRSRVASLHGTAWQAFLTDTSPNGKRRRTAFDEDMGRLIAMAPYAPPGSASLVLEGVDVGRDGVMAAARDWIRWNS